MYTTGLEVPIERPYIHSICLDDTWYPNMIPWSNGKQEESGQCDLPTNRLVLYLNGVVQRPTMRREYGFEPLPHLEFKHITANSMLQWFELEAISDMRLKKPVWPERLWRVWIWNDGVFDPNNYMMGEDFARTTLEIWLSHSTRT